MSWEEQTNNNTFSITTGDKNTYYPLWKETAKTISFNVTKYNFINTPGSQVDRKEVQSGVYPIKIWFQGEFYLEEASNFEKSSAVRKLWNVNHPRYGKITGHPAKLKRVDTDLNIVQFEIDFWESINVSFPGTNISPLDQNVASRQAANIVAAENFGATASPVQENIAPFTDKLATTFAQINPPTDAAADFISAAKSAYEAAENVVDDAQKAMTEIQAVYNTIILYELPILDKLRDLRNSYLAVKVDLTDRFSKESFEAQAANILLSMAVIVLNPASADFLTRSSVQEANDLLLSTYSDYVGTLDSVAVSVYNVNNSYNPNVNNQTDLYKAIVLTLNSLFEIAFNAKQEREITLAANTTLHTLVHELIGLDSADVNIDEFRENNSIRLEELFILQRGRKIIYYI